MGTNGWSGYMGDGPMAIQETNDRQLVFGRFRCRNHFSMGIPFGS
jgi:hypothetical protein